MSTFNIPSLYWRSKKHFPKLSLFASWPGTMINPQWLELPMMSRTNFYGLQDVRAIDVRLYVLFWLHSVKKKTTFVCQLIGTCLMFRTKINVIYVQPTITWRWTLHVQWNCKTNSYLFPRTVFYILPHLHLCIRHTLHYWQDKSRPIVANIHFPRTV